MFIEKYGAFIRIDGTRKTYIFYLNRVVKIVVDSFGVSIPAGFLVTPSGNSASIESHLDILRISSYSSLDLSRNTSFSIMADEG